MLLEFTRLNVAVETIRQVLIPNECIELHNLLLVLSFLRQPVFLLNFMVVQQLLVHLLNLFDLRFGERFLVVYSCAVGLRVASITG